MKTTTGFFREVNLCSNVVRYTRYQPESRESPEVLPLWDRHLVNL